MLKWTAFLLMSLSLVGLVITAVTVIRQVWPIFYMFL